MDSSLPPFKIFSGTKSRYMAEEICKELGVELGSMKIEHFADGEFEVSFEESVRGCEVYLVQSTFPNCDNLMELLLMIDAAKRASAKTVIAVMPIDSSQAARHVAAPTPPLPRTRTHGRGAAIYGLAHL